MPLFSEYMANYRVGGILVEISVNGPDKVAVVSVTGRAAGWALGLESGRSSVLRLPLCISQMDLFCLRLFLHFGS